MPAQLTAQSSEPNSLSEAATIASASASTATSTRIPTACPPAELMASATAEAFSPFMSVTTTEAPSCANALAVASPMPLPPPVTTAALPPNKDSCSDMSPPLSPYCSQSPYSNPQIIALKECALSAFRVLFPKLRYPQGAVRRVRLAS